MLQTCDKDMDLEVFKIKQSAPYLVITGKPGDINCQISEQESVVESNSVSDAIIDLIAAYFTFNITYPKFIKCMLLFIQHFVFGLKDSQEVPMVVTNIVRNLEKCESNTGNLSIVLPCYTN